jgi:predicted dithiol-disulfide oxidoreductase (DUF899 family)/DNA-binding transcriptional ArsR family regulator
MPPDIEAIAEQVFIALADPSRRAILAALASGGPATATDLADRLPITRQAIAKHLALLAEVGLVTAEPGERRRVRYRLRSAPMQVAQQFLAALARDWDGPLEALKDHLDRVLVGPPQPHSTKPEDIMADYGFTTTTMKNPPIVTLREWEAAHQQLLVKEKEMTRARDALAAERRRMPWLAVEKEYGFDGPEGKVTLLDLFEGRRQLIVYRAFFEPGVFGWPDHACRGCSLVADQVAHVAHLNARDTTLVFVSRAPQPDIARVKARMGWTMPWYTMTDEFDTDFGVDEWHGTNAFIRNGDEVFRTYFINNRGDEALGSTWSYLDMTALGRQEEWEDSPEGYHQTPPYVWRNWHDEYGDAEPSQG